MLKNARPCFIPTDRSGRRRPGENIVPQMEVQFCLNVGWQWPSLYPNRFLRKPLKNQVKEINMESTNRFWMLAGCLIFAAVTLNADQVKVKADGTQVMLGDKVLTTLNAGAELEVVKRHGQWVGVSIDIDGQRVSGWLKADQVEVVAAAGMSLAVTAANGGKQVPIPHMLACIRGKGIDDLVMKAQQMVMQVNPLLAGAVSADMFGKPFGMQGLPGVDRKAPFAMVILNPEKFKEGAVMVFPVSDFNALANANQNGRFKVVAAGNFACISRDAGAASLVAQALQGVAAIDLSGMKDDFEIRVQTKPIMDAAGPHIATGVTSLTEAIKAGAAAGAGGNPELTANILKAEIDWLLGLLKQTDEFSVGLGMGMNGLTLRQTVNATAGTKLSEWIGGVPAADNKLIGGLPAGEALMTMNGSVGSKGWQELYLGFTRDILKAMNMTDESILKMAESIMSKFTGTMSMSADMNQDGLVLAYNIGTQGDLASEMRKGMDEFLKGPWMEKYKELGLNFELDYKPAARTLDGISIDAFTYSMYLPKGTENNPAVKMQFDMMKKIYGDPMRYEIAYLPDSMLFVMGKNTSGITDKLIAQSKAGQANIPVGLQDAETAMGKGAQLYGAFSLKRLVDVVDIVMSLTVPGMQAGGAPAVQIPGPSVTMAWRTNGTTSEVEVAIPARPLAALQGYFMQKIMQMQQQKQQQPGQQEAPPAQVF